MRAWGRRNVLCISMVSTWQTEAVHGNFAICMPTDMLETAFESCSMLFLGGSRHRSNAAFVVVQKAIDFCGREWKARTKPGGITKSRDL